MPVVTQYAFGPDVTSCGPGGGAEDPSSGAEDPSLDAEDASLDDDPEFPDAPDVPDVPEVPDSPDIEPEDPPCPVDAGGEVDPEAVPDADDPPEEGGVEFPAVLPDMPPGPTMPDVDDPLAVPGSVREEGAEPHPMIISEPAARKAARDRAHVSEDFIEAQHVSSCGFVSTSAAGRALSAARPITRLARCACRFQNAPRARGERARVAGSQLTRRCSSLSSIFMALIARTRSGRSLRRGALTVPRAVAWPAAGR